MLLVCLCVVARATFGICWHKRPTPSTLYPTCEHVLRLGLEYISPTLTFTHRWELQSVFHSLYFCFCHLCPLIGTFEYKSFFSFNCSCNPLLSTCTSSNPCVWRLSSASFSLDSTFRNQADYSSSVCLTTDHSVCIWSDAFVARLQTSAISFASWVVLTNSWWTLTRVVLSQSYSRNLFAYTLCLCCNDSILNCV